MRRLMLLRHAKTETDAPSGRDQDRRLDPRGHRDAAEIGSWLAAHPPFPDAVLVSPAIRAKQTWELAWEVMKDHVPAPHVEFAPELYGADPAQMLQSMEKEAGIELKLQTLEFQTLLSRQRDGNYQASLIGRAPKCPMSA